MNRETERSANEVHEWQMRLRALMSRHEPGSLHIFSIGPDPDMKRIRVVLSKYDVDVVRMIRAIVPASGLNLIVREGATAEGLIAPSPNATRADKR